MGFEVDGAKGICGRLGRLFTLSEAVFVVVPDLVCCPLCNRVVTYAEYWTSHISFSRYYYKDNSNVTGGLHEKAGIGISQFYTA